MDEYVTTDRLWEIPSEGLDAIDDVNDCSVSIFDASNVSTVECDGISLLFEEKTVVDCVCDVNPDDSEISLVIESCE